MVPVSRRSRQTGMGRFEAVGEMRGLSLKLSHPSTTLTEPIRNKVCLMTKFGGVHHAAKRPSFSCFYFCRSDFHRLCPYARDSDI